MYPVRAAVDGVVTEVRVDEGQMVAEGDVLVVLDTGERFVAVATDEPGVVRELHVQAGDAVSGDATVAMIDES